jgi:hypothetical protein
MSENINSPSDITIKIAELEPGNVINPTLKFNNNESTGIYSDIGGSVSIASTGDKILSVDKNKIQFNKPLLISNSDSSFTGSNESIYLYRKSGDLYFNNGAETKIGGGGGGGSSGAKVLNPVKYVTNMYSDPTSTASNTIDFATVEVGDRILLIGSSPARYNGIYTVVTVGTGSNGVLERASDYNNAANMSVGDQVTVLEGRFNRGKTYYVSNAPTELDNPSNFGSTGFLSFNELPIREYTVSYSTDISGAWSRSNASMTLTRVGRMCSLMLFNNMFTAVSNDHLNFVNAIPEDFRPPVTQFFLIPGKNNGVFNTCLLSINNSGIIQISSSAEGSAFTDGDECGFRPTTINWTR